MDQPVAPSPRAGLELIDFAAVALYLIVTAGIVVWSSWRKQSTEEYFLGGRRMPWFAIGLSLLATLMSSISYMGVPGEVVSNGITMFFQYLALPFSMTVVLGVWVPFFMRLRFTSAYEYLEKRFDYRARLLGGFLFLFMRLGWMSMVMYVGSLALSQMTFTLVPEGRSDPLAVLISPSAAETVMLRDTLLYWIVGCVGLSATCYACMGGFRAAVWNDVLQSLMFLGGTFVTLGYVMWTTGTGPMEWWRITTESAPKHVQPIWFSLDPTVRMTVFTAGLLSFFWTICTHGSDQVVLQRYFSTTSLKSARRSYIVNALTDLTIGTLLAASGLALLAFYTLNPNYLPAEILSNVDGKLIVKHGDRVMPYFFAHQLPAGIGGIVLAVVLCDAMQTLVSGVNSISAVFTTDVFERLYKGEKKWLSDVGFAKILTTVIGLLVTCTAIGVAYFAQHSKRNIIDMMAPAFNMFLGPLASLFLIGMFLKCRGNSALTGTVCGMIISFIWSYWRDLFGTSYHPSITLTTAVPYLSSFIIAAVVSQFETKDPSFSGLAYTWSAVMKLPEPKDSSDESEN